MKLRTVRAEIYTTRDRRHTLRADRSGHRGRAADPQPRVRARDLTLLAWPIAAAALAGASSVAIWTFGRMVMDASRPGEESYSIVAWMVLGAFGVLGAAAGKIVEVWSIRTAWIVTSLALAGSTIVLGVAPGAPAAACISVALFAASYTTLSWCSHHLGRAPGSGSPS